MHTLSGQAYSTLALLGSNSGEQLARANREIARRMTIVVVPVIHPLHPWDRSGQLAQHQQPGFRGECDEQQSLQNQSNLSLNKLPKKT